MSSIFLTNLEKNYQKINNIMGLIFIPVYLLIVLIFCFIVFVYLELEKLKTKQEQEFQHVLKNLKYFGNLIEHYFKNEK